MHYIWSNMKGSRAIPALPIPVKRALAKLGADISAARRRRRIPTELMAERAFVSRNTITRVEKGDPRVSMGIYATVFFVLGLEEKLSDIADASTDRIGLDLEHERLPERVRMPRTTAAKRHGA
jgi:transcriptional regulator with XRE-family HTH domain